MNINITENFLPKEKFKEIAQGMFKKTQDHFNFKCQLDGAMKVGSNWSETH